MNDKDFSIHRKQWLNLNIIHPINDWIFDPFTMANLTANR